MKVMDFSLDKIQTPVEGLSPLITIVSEWCAAVCFAGDRLLFEGRFHLQDVSRGEEKSTTLLTPQTQKDHSNR
jgi:hypothetical protein